jgi:hypothetical protein
MTLSPTLIASNILENGVFTFTLIVVSESRLDQSLGLLSDGPLLTLTLKVHYNIDFRLHLLLGLLCNLEVLVMSRMDIIMSTSGGSSLAVMMADVQRNADTSAARVEPVHALSRATS